MGRDGERNQRIFISDVLIVSGLDSSFALDRYVIRLSDKNNSPYSITNPSAYLSAKAIARRAAHNIPIDQTDLPVNPAYITGIANTGALVLSTSKWLNTVTVYTTDPLVVSAIQALPYVLNLSSVGKQSMQGQKDNKFEQIPLKKHTLPNVMAKTSGFDYGLATNQIHMRNGEVLHNAGYRGDVSQRRESWQSWFSGGFLKTLVDLRSFGLLSAFSSRP